MPLKDITQKIINEAEAEAAKIREDALRKVKDIERELEARKKEMANTCRVRLEKKLAQEEAAFLSGARKQCGVVLEEKKRECVEKAFTSAFKKIEDLPGEEYERLLSFILKKSSLRGVVKIVIPERRKKESLSILASLGYDGETETAKDMRGGCRIVGEAYDVDFSFEKMFADKKGEFEIAVSKILFG